MITPNELKDVLEYRDGQLYRLHGRFAGLVKGTKQQNGRLTLKVKGEQFYYHRVVWALVHGVWPSEIDHIDRNPQNNHIDNLRDVTHRVNNFNRGVARDNKHDVTGVSYSKTRDRANKWRAYFGRKFLGWFATKDEAVAARAKAEVNSPEHLRVAA